MRIAPKRRLFIVAALAVVSGCATVASSQWTAMFGEPEPRDRMVAADTVAGEQWFSEVQPVLEQRCMVCHGCYDSPCQLNMTSPEGLDRGASKEKVYNGGRISAAVPTRMFEDAQTTAEWREKGFWPVLNEHEQNAQVNLEASLIYHMLDLKRDNPLPDTEILDEKEFDLTLDRKQFCAAPDEIRRFKARHPTWGMPYAMPALSDAEFATVEGWLRGGARMAQPPAISGDLQAAVADWEAFLNGDSLKQQLVSRYLYEHWFLAHLYFGDIDDAVFFKIVRSATPPGQPLAPVGSRRPYDDPGIERVYYRLHRDRSTVLDKTHMPYALNAERMTWLKALFIEPEFEVPALPGYDADITANPFITFEALPPESRWTFLRAEAQFTIMNFIKGPVCRGQVAVDVIRDNFWVFFTDGKFWTSEEAVEFLSEQQANLSLPVEAGSRVGPLRVWKRYSKLQDQYLLDKSEFITNEYPGGMPVDLDLIWDGDGDNPNAALTVFRHFDNATVVKGLVGPMPKTAWVIDYPILERIHYLLVAGFDVYGNLGHQLTTRLYMDFLRMESESNFLALLPPEYRRKEAEGWYAGASANQLSYVYNEQLDAEFDSVMKYSSDFPKAELFVKLHEHLRPVLNTQFHLEQPDVPQAHQKALKRLASNKGSHLTVLPEMSILHVQGSNGSDYYYTVLLNVAHRNITGLFSESKNFAPDEYTLTVINGFLGSYPDAFWQVDEAELDEMVDGIAGLTGEESFTAFMDRYGVRRTAPDFWQHSDKVLEAHIEANPIENGLFDYNRFGNR